MNTTQTTYLLDIPDLVEAVAGATTTYKHTALLSALRRHSGSVDLAQPHGF
jgi:hypothetical protein